MFGRKKMKDEILELRYRVAELEERLCPCEEHRWKQIGWSYQDTYTYKCRRCGKVIKSIFSGLEMGADDV